MVYKLNNFGSWSDSVDEAQGKKEKPKKEYIVPDLNLVEKGRERRKKIEEDKEKVVGIFWILFWLFIGWIFLGGIFSSGDYDSENTVKVDCRKSGWENSKYCNGEFESQTQEQEYIDNSYYQNVVR